MWVLIAWKEFKDRKMKNVCEIAECKEPSAALESMKTFNAQKLKTTSDYNAYNLSELYENRGLKIAESIETETT